MLKITGGQFRGRTVKAIESENLRPTTSFFREWLFNILNNCADLSGGIVLDLFAGSGIVGLEFLSRGAKELICVESAAKVVAQLKENLRLLKSDALSSVYQQEVCSFLESNSLWHRANFIFFDPPYQAGVASKVLSLIDRLHPHKSSLIVIIESSSAGQPPLPDGWQIYKQKKTGTTLMNVLNYQRE